MFRMFLVKKKALKIRPIDYCHCCTVMKENITQTILVFHNCLDIFHEQALIRTVRQNSWFGMQLG